jgi:hypothetical protein
MDESNAIKHPSSRAFRVVRKSVELRHQYSLGYYPQQAAPGQQRRIKVRVTRPKLIVRARNSYGLEPAEAAEPSGQRK